MMDKLAVKPTPAEALIGVDGAGYETRWEAMKGKGYLTPNELFFVRNRTATPRIDAESWRLRVEGPAVRAPREFRYAELLEMPAVTLVRAVECAGNGRRFFAAEGRPIPGGAQWGLGAIGVAEWTGVPLRAVLAQVGLKPTVQDVMLEGLDEERFGRQLPIAKALENDTLLAYRMNGEPLPPDHGFPVRAIVSGWAAVVSVKWLGRIIVAEEPLYNKYNTEEYVMIGPGFSPEPPALGSPVKWMNVNSAFELTWDARLPAGPITLTGRSWSGLSRIARVEVSTDDAATWQLARLLEPDHPHAWCCWEFAWTAPPGRHVLRARATDEMGNTQPDSALFNEKGYLYNAVVPHPVVVE